MEMNREEFISKLKLKLANLPKEEIENALNYYNEYFDEAGKENEFYVLKELGSSSKIASQIIANYTINDINKSPKSAKKGILSLKIALKALFASSIALPAVMCISILSFIFIVLAVLVSICIIVTAVTALAVGAMSIVFGVALMLDIPTAIFFIGIGISILGVGIILGAFFKIVSKVSFGWIAKFVSRTLLRRNNHGIK